MGGGPNSVPTDLNGEIPGQAPSTNEQNNLRFIGSYFQTKGLDAPHCLVHFLCSAQNRRLQAGPDDQDQRVVGITYRPAVGPPVSALDDPIERNVPQDRSKDGSLRDAGLHAQRLPAAACIKLDPSIAHIVHQYAVQIFWATLDPKR